MRTSSVLIYRPAWTEKRSIYQTPTAISIWYSVLAVAIALGAGVSAALVSRIEFVLVPAILFVVQVVLRLSLIEATVILVPIMFHLSAGLTLNVSAADVLLPLLALNAVSRRSSFSASRPMAYSFILITILVVSLVSGILSDGSFNVSAGLIATFKVAVGALFMVVFFVEAQHSSDFSRLTRIWTRTALVLASLGLASAMGVMSLARTEDGVRTSGSFEDPNLFGAYLAMSLALVFSPHNASGLVAKYIQASILLGAIVTTASRGTILALGVMLIVAVVIAPSLSRKVRIACTVLLAMIALEIIGASSWSSSIPGLDRLLSSSQSADSDVRFELWSLALRLWQENPLLGVGIGQYQEYRSHVAHNTFLSFLAETGLLGLVVFLVLPAYLLNRLFALRSDGHSRSLLLGLVALLLEMASLNLQNVRFVWIFLAMALVSISMTERHRDGRSKDWIQCHETSSRE